MSILGVPAGPVVGEAYRFLLELRMNEGPLEPEEARKRLLEWAASRASATSLTATPAV